MDELSEWQQGVLSKLPLKGETIKSVDFEEDMDSWFIIEFQSGRSLRIRYDWIYELEYDGKVIGRDF